MDEQSRGWSGRIITGVAVVILSAKLASAFWPQLTSLGTTIRQRTAELFETDSAQENDGPAGEPDGDLATPQDGDRSTSADVASPPCCRERCSSRRH